MRPRSAGIKPNPDDNLSGERIHHFRGTSNQFDAARWQQLAENARAVAKQAANFQSLIVIADRRRIGTIGVLGFLRECSFLLAFRFFFLFCPLYSVSLGALKAVIGSAHSIHLLIGGGYGWGLSKYCPWLRLGTHPVLV